MDTTASDFVYAGSLDALKVKAVNRQNVGDVHFLYHLAMSIESMFGGFQCRRAILARCSSAPAIGKL
jgi:hypothetical protein